MCASTANAILVGSLKEFVSNPLFYRYSHVGMEYSEITSVGEAELKKIMALNLSLLRDSMQRDLEDAAKEYVMAELKK